MPGASPTSPPRALIVEDSAIIAMDLEQRLTRMGFDVCGVSSRAQRAVDLAREFRPDLVLLDYNLQGALTGIDAARIIRAEGNAAILFVTGRASSVSDSELVDLRAAILAKPLDDAGLAAAIRSAFAIQR